MIKGTGARPSTSSKLRCCAPTDPSVAVFELASGRSPHQHGDPVAVAGDDRTEEIPDGLGGAEGMMLGQQGIEALRVGVGDDVDMEF